MPSPAAKSLTSVVLVCGEDEFSVKERSRQLFQQWSADTSGAWDQEIIDAGASNSADARRALARFREAIQTLPFFGGPKVVWFQNCAFLGDERAATAQAVTEALADVAEELRTLSDDSIRVLISAGKVDKRRAFYKTLEKFGRVENHEGWSLEDEGWMAEAEAWTVRQLRARNKEISDEALGRLIEWVGPNPRQLRNELEKLALFAGDRPEISSDDVTRLVSRNKQARAFALAEALADRDLPRVLRRLDEELWEMKTDTKKSEIGLLYGLISKVRQMILLRDCLQAGWLKPESDYRRFKAQWERLPLDALPEDKRFNLRSMNPYALFKALSQARRYSLGELIRAMDLLLHCNQLLVSSDIDEKLALQRTLIQIVQPPAAPS